MGKEVPLQHEMFTGELVDTRSSKQKRRDAERIKPRQSEMFPTREVAQFGVNSRPRLSLINQRGTPVGMKLEIQDPRTEEEKGCDRMKVAESKTYSLFGNPLRLPEIEPLRTKQFPSGLRLALVESEEEEQGIALTEDLVLLYWTTRDEEYNRARDTYHRDGYRTFEAGDDQLEIWQADESGYWLVTYSDIEMIENVEWTDQTKKQFYGNR